jgi:hypothetical protein
MAAEDLDILIGSHSSLHGASKEEPLKAVVGRLQATSGGLHRARVGLDREGPHVVDVESVIRRVFCAKVGNTRLSEGEVSTAVDDVESISPHELSISCCYQVARERALEL